LKATAKVLLVVAVPLLAGAWSLAHFELISSYPKKDQAVGAAPIDISLVFSESADSARSSIALQGPAGAVPLGPVRTQDESLVLLAKVLGTMSPGAYTVSWVSAAPGDELVRGSFRFTVGRAR
jgi:methionine-rich copper-binding protein CopC